MIAADIRRGNQVRTDRVEILATAALRPPNSMARRTLPVDPAVVWGGISQTLPGRSIVPRFVQDVRIVPANRH